MDSRTGDTYPTKAAAIEAGVPEADLVQLEGEPRAIRRIARRVRMAARDISQRRIARRKMQKASRRANRSKLAAVLLAVLGLALGGCAPTEPTPPGIPTSSNTCTVTGANSTCNIGNGNGTVTNPTPNPSASPGGDNVVDSFAIFCYGFGAQPGQPEPNHNACVLPVGYPNIAVTASPKNKAGIDVPNPGDQTSDEVIDWNFSVSPTGAASLAIQGDNRFNARVEPASPRVAANFTLVATYRDPQGNIRVATKGGGIQ